MFSDEEISVFLDELEEKIQILNENILLLEREGASPETIQEIFRAAHTIKGSSGVMGYEKMASLTHEMENLFDQMRKGLLPVTGRLVDTLFTCPWRRPVQDPAREKKERRNPRSLRRWSWKRWTMK